MSQVGFAQIGENQQPSPSIWADCPNTLLNDKGLGYFAHEDFLGAAVSAAMLPTITVGGGKFSFDGDTDTVFSLKASEQGGYLDVETDGDDNDAAAIFTEPLGPITRNSGKKFWFEARVELGGVAEDQGFFVGLVEEAGASRDVLADDVGTDGVIGESLIGFLVDNEDDNAFKVVYRKDAGTVVTLVADATNSTAIPLASRASLLADTEVKVGLRFDGRTKLYFYVNGYEVAAQDVDSTLDQSKNYCAILAIKTGAAAAESFAADWVRYGFQARN